MDQQLPRPSRGEFKVRYIFIAHRRPLPRSPIRVIICSPSSKTAIASNGYFRLAVGNRSMSVAGNWNFIINRNCSKCVGLKGRGSWNYCPLKHWPPILRANQNSNLITPRVILETVYFHLLGNRFREGILRPQTVLVSHRYRLTNFSAFQGIR